jgi:hypothetical protein
MKSFVAFPSDLEKVNLSQITHRNSSGKLIPHVELYKKVQSLQGSIVKCGIAAEEGFTRFMALKGVRTVSEPHMLAFEKYVSADQRNETSMSYRINNASVSIDDYQKAMVQKGAKENITFIPGHVDDSIANYLIHNPELKISYLNIDLNDYNMTTTCLEFFYPRLMHRGVLIFDNYYKQQEEFRAVNDYFMNQRLRVNSFSGSFGPHFIFRD